MRGSIAGPGLVFNGTSDSLVIPNSENRNLNFPMNSFSLSLWVNVSENAGDWDTPFKKGGSDSTTPGYSIELGNGGWGATLASEDPVDPLYLDLGSYSQLMDTWAHLALVVDRDALLAHTSVNGIPDDDIDLTGHASMGGTDIAMIGRDGPNNFFKGGLDELRVHSVARSAAWWKAEFDNVDAPTLFVTIGPEVAAGR